MNHHNFSHHTTHNTSTKVIGAIALLVIATIFAVIAYTDSHLPNKTIQTLSFLKEEIHTEEELEAFRMFIEEQRRTYFSNEEHLFRLRIFAKNRKIIEEHNSHPDYTFKLAVNQFADLTQEEFQYYYVSSGVPARTGEPYEMKNNKDFPTSYDWRNYGAVTSVGNQGSCGSCWAFSACAALEGALKVQHGWITPLSEQQLVDCAGGFGNYGCSGGWMDNAFVYAAIYGLQSYNQYPYVGFQQSCKDTSNPVVQVAAYVDIPSANANALLEALLSRPLSVTVQANQYVFQYYSSGILNWGCGTDMDHGVALVGYGYDSASNQPFWIVKNSWGTSWGEQGYVRILRTMGDNQPQVCGVALAGSYPIVY